MMPQGSSCSEAKPEWQQQEAGGTPGSGLPWGALTTWQSHQESLLPPPRPHPSEGAGGRAGAYVLSTKVYGCCPVKRPKDNGNVSYSHQEEITVF